MHSHERTMLAKLGFADPDRREQRHDVACQYLATPDAIRRLIPYLKIECGPEPHAENSGSEEDSPLNAATIPLRHPRPRVGRAEDQLPVLPSLPSYNTKNKKLRRNDMT